MKIDDSFLKKEAAKRRFYFILIALGFLSFGSLSVLIFNGYFESHPKASRLVLYSQVVGFAILYFWLKRRFSKEISD